MQISLCSVPVENPGAKLRRETTIKEVLNHRVRLTAAQANVSWRRQMWVGNATFLKTKVMRMFVYRHTRHPYARTCTYTDQTFVSQPTIYSTS